MCMTTPHPDIQFRLNLAVEAAREAGEITLEYFRRDDLEVERKGDDSPVTVADRAAEQHLRQRIAEAFAEDGILGEEFPERPGSSGYRWILDPIDGTKSFIHGVPLYGTLVGVECEGESVIGVILIPALDECVYASIGQGAWYTSGGDPPRLARVSDKIQLAESCFLTSEVGSFDEIDRRGVFLDTTDGVGSQTAATRHAWLHRAVGQRQIVGLDSFRREHFERLSQQNARVSVRPRAAGNAEYPHRETP